jgi:hypothetical protein
MKWTDEKVKEFCKIYTQPYSHSGFEHCRTIDSKIKKYKELKDTGVIWKKITGNVLIVK